MSRHPPDPKILAKRVESFFGERVRTISAPGGKRRGSYRVNFAKWSLIISFRGDIARCRHEALVLEQLQDQCSVTPRFLGCDQELLFQEDVGGTRISQHIHSLSPIAREALADQAVAGIFAFQGGARNTSLAQNIPQLGATPEWVAAFVNGIDRVMTKLQLEPVAYNPEALCEFIGTPALQFLKWDCRAGNAAVNTDGAVKWFDFEYAGMRHGAEDFAWLLGDENWPVDPALMLDLVQAHQKTGDGREWPAYRDYLTVYTTLHVFQRILLILRGVKRKGWISKERALRFDNVGTNPVLAERICQLGEFMANQHALTEPLGSVFAQARQKFAQVIQPATPPEPLLS